MAAFNRRDWNMMNPPTAGMRDPDMLPDADVPGVVTPAERTPEFAPPVIPPPTLPPQRPMPRLPGVPAGPPPNPFPSIPGIPGGGFVGGGGDVSAGPRRGGMRNPRFRGSFRATEFPQGGTTSMALGGFGGRVGGMQEPEDDDVSRYLRGGGRGRGRGGRAVL